MTTRLAQGALRDACAAIGVRIWSAQLRYARRGGGGAAGARRAARGSTPAPALAHASQATPIEPRLPHYFVYQLACSTRRRPLRARPLMRLSARGRAEKGNGAFSSDNASFRRAPIACGRRGWARAPGVAPGAMGQLVRHEPPPGDPLQRLLSALASNGGGGSRSGLVTQAQRAALNGARACVPRAARGRAGRAAAGSPVCRDGVPLAARRRRCAARPNAWRRARVSAARPAARRAGRAGRSRSRRWRARW